MADKGCGRAYRMRIWERNSSVHVVFSTWVPMMSTGELPAAVRTE
jgi:hypothetical protein